MAKKRSMNIFLTHVEKAALAVAAGVMLWIFFSFFVRPPGVEVQGEIVSASKALEEASKEADDILADMKTKSAPPPEAPQYVVNPFENVKKFEGTQLALQPINKSGVGIEEDRQYRVPAIPTLAETKITLDHLLAVVPPEDPTQTRTNVTMPRGQEEWQKDVSLVTVSATFPISKVYEDFEKSFGPGIKKPLEIYEPVLAMVQLQRRRLMPDGNWSDYETAPRLEGDPLQEQFTLEQVQEMTQTRFQVSIGDRRNYGLQLEMMQPFPYEIAQGGGEWTDPTLTEEERKQRNRPGRTGRLGSRLSPRSRTRTPTRSPMNEEMFDEEMMEDMMLEGGRSTAPTYRTPFRRGGRYGQQQNKPQEFTQEKIHVWAFDSKAVPGGIYSYRLRIGFFNPIAGRNWFREDQKDLRFQRILWTDWTSPPSLVSIPRRTYFFPKSTMTTVADSSISVEIFRKQMGEWHKRTFRVAAGSEIGAIIKEKRQLSRPGAVLGRQSPLPSRNPLGRPTAQNTETVEVDYRTGATVVDVLHDQNHWVIKPNITQNINCTEIVYRDNDGDIKRIGSNKGTWPAELVNIYNKIQRDISKQKKPSPRDMRRRMSSFDDESM